MVLISDFACFHGCVVAMQLVRYISQGWICYENCTCCHSKIEIADNTYLTQSQYTDNRPTSPSTGFMPPGAWQHSHQVVNFQFMVYISPPEFQPQDPRHLRWTH